MRLSRSHAKFHLSQMELLRSFAQDSRLPSAQPRALRQPVLRELLRRFFLVESQRPSPWPWQALARLRAPRVCAPVADALSKIAQNSAWQAAPGPDCFSGLTRCPTGPLRDTGW